MSFITRIKLIAILLLVFLSLQGGHAFAKGNFAINAFSLDNAKSIFVINGNNKNKAIEYTDGYLASPHRYFVDIQNALLLTGPESMNVFEEGLTNIKIAQYSHKPDKVRIVFTADSKRRLDKIQIKPLENSIAFKLGSFENKAPITSTTYQDNHLDSLNRVFSTYPQTVFNKEAPPSPVIITGIEEPVIPIANLADGEENIISRANFSQNKDIIKKLKENLDQNLVTSVKVQSNQILLAGVGSLTVKKPFKLTKPSRVVFDIPNSYPASKELLQEFLLKNTDKVKVGQFDDETVRVVVQTKYPDKYRAIISPDLQSIIISDGVGVNLKDFPNTIAEANVENITIEKHSSDSSLVTLFFSEPIIHSVKHYFNKVKLNFYNVKNPEESFVSNLTSTEQVEKTSLYTIPTYPNGSSWVFTIPANARVKTGLSQNGKVLELLIKDPLVPFKNMFAGQGKKVVIDAGHGGYDPGAQKDGIYEKDIAIDIARRVKKYLRQSGLNVIMTRKADETVSLKKRCKISNNSKPQAFVSIHLNSSRRKNIKGTEVHWYNRKSLKLAKAINENLALSVNTEDRGVFRSMFYVIHHNIAPAVLVEVGFLSNDKERYQMLTEERKEATAKSISYGVLMYLSSKYSAGKNETK